MMSKFRSHVKSSNELDDELKDIFNVITSFESINRTVWATFFIKFDRYSTKTETVLSTQTSSKMF